MQVPDEVAAVDTAPIQISNVKVRKDYNPKGLLIVFVNSSCDILFIIEVDCNTIDII